MLKKALSIVSLLLLFLTYQNEKIEKNSAFIALTETAFADKDKPVYFQEELKSSEFDRDQSSELSIKTV